MSEDSTQPRLRLVSWRVQPVVVVDDGDTLTPLQVPAIDINANAWEKFKAGGDVQALADLQQQLDS